MKMETSKKVLITGGPVHCYLDAVKIITNRFKGGLIAELADNLISFGAEVTYVHPHRLETKLPKSDKGLKLLPHQGIEDYQRLVLELAPQMDAVILGAAVANLIPAEPFTGKFPSHNYRPGDIIPINFTIAPRIIDRVRGVAPHTQLFGFKLLSGVSYEDLIGAAYEIVLNSAATAVFANDTGNLLKKYAVTRERAVHELSQGDLAEWIWDVINDLYYRTVLMPDQSLPAGAVNKIKKLLGKFADKFVAVEDGTMFGTIAVRYKSGFVTTGRGKKELDDIVRVLRVSHKKREVISGPRKASLNAPLLARIFENPKVDHVVHYHKQEPSLPTFSYAPPGTVRDTNRPNHISYNIEAHGCILLFDKDGRRL